MLRPHFRSAPLPDIRRGADRSGFRLDQPWRRRDFLILPCRLTIYDRALFKFASGGGMRAYLVAIEW